MSKISTYPSADVPLQLSDRLIGTEAIRPIPSPTPLATKNFSLGELLQLFSSNFPAASLQAVLDTGNTATQNITLIGTIDTTLIKPDNIEDTSGSQGVTFQFLSKGTSSINWVDLPISNLQSVLNAGNTATQNIFLIGDITTTKIIPGNIQDDTLGIGMVGQFLSKSASGIKWVNNPIATTPGLADVLSVGNTATNDITLIGDITANSFIKSGGTNLQYLMADGSVTTGGSYTLPVATISILGGVKIGSGVSVALDGTISVSTNYQAPLSGTGFVKISGTTISYDNSTYYLASNPSGFTSNLGTVTSVSALPLGTTGTDLSLTVANSTTTPVITLNVPTASATNRGALSSTDWSIFNSKLPTQAGATTGVALTFVTDRVYGTIASPETGNIAFSTTGALLGVTNIIIHNNTTTAPTFAANMKKLSGSSSYVVNTINYIYVTYINATEVIYSINQRT